MGYSWGMRPGALIGDFEVERLAGSGGMGEVFRAHDRRTGTPVALKVLRGQRFQHQHAERFAREARLLSELHVGSSRVDLQACKLEYSIVSPK